MRKISSISGFLGISDITHAWLERIEAGLSSMYEGSVGLFSAAKNESDSDSDPGEVDRFYIFGMDFWLAFDKANHSCFRFWRTNSTYMDLQKQPDLKAMTMDCFVKRSPRSDRFCSFAVQRRIYCPPRSRRSALTS